MRISLNLILHELGYEWESFADSEANPSFECVELLTARNADMSGKALLVCTLSEALDITGREPGAGVDPRGLYFLCIRDRMVDAREKPESMRGIMIIKRNIELRELLNEAQRIFVRISGWVIAMQRSVMKDEGIQELVTMSEGIIGNHIAVMDSTFKLMAYTKNIETDDPGTNSLIRLGYHPEETVRRLQLYRRLEHFEKEDDVAVSDDLAISNYVTVKKAFHNRDGYSIIVVMVCCVKPLFDGLLDLFRLLIDNLQIYVNREYPPKGESSPLKALISDILEQKAGAEGEARSRAAFAGLAMESDYDLFLVAFDDEANTPISRLLAELSERLPHANVLSYQRSVIILNCYEGARAAAGREEYLAHVDGAIDGLAACCGVSSRFTTLMDLPAAYEQASVAIRLGKRLRGRSLVYTDIPDHGARFYYEDYILFNQALLSLTQNRDMLKNTFIFRALKILGGQEKKNGVPYIRILHTYLQYERRATEACARLHMHRNTVLYHINRIEEILGVSLDDPEVRLKLSLSVKFHELESAEELYLR